jgi:hypothetical protein
VKDSLGKPTLGKMGVLLFVWILALSAVVQTANAALTRENIQNWLWTNSTMLNSIAIGDVDGDGDMETITGGYYNDGTGHPNNAQLCVWDGATLAVENVEVWKWWASTRISSVAVGDVDGDAQIEIVTGGYYNDGRNNAQLCVWDGEDLALENVQTWCWTDDTEIWSVAIGNVDGDAQIEIVTGGNYYDGTGDNAQLCVWNGATLALENVQTWCWTEQTEIFSVAIGNVDGDGSIEIATGGDCENGNIPQLCVWEGATLALENVVTWEDGYYITSVAVGDVDGDAAVEIATGGIDWDANISAAIAQLCVWS